MNSNNDSKLTVITDHTKNKNETKLGKQLEHEGCHKGVGGGERGKGTENK